MARRRRRIRRRRGTRKLGGYRLSRGGVRL